MGVETDKYLTAVEKQLSKITDPIARAIAANDEITAQGEVLGRLAAVRSDAVRAARGTMSAVDVAAQLGVTRARIYQIVQERA